MISSAPKRTYGRIIYWKDRKQYVLALQPDVRGKIKRFFPWAKAEKDAVIIPDTPPNCEDLEMMLGRWPLDSPDASDQRIIKRAADARAAMAQCEMILTSKPREFKTLLPLRDYQGVAVDLLMHSGHLLVGDDLGLGKTVVGLGAIAAGAGPAIIICKGHLVGQWQEEAEKFLGMGLNVHIQRTGKEQELPHHEILIMPYSMLTKWASRLFGYGLIIFDEVQELRRDESEKYKAAMELRSNCTRGLALSATPIYNYGDEMFNIMEIVAPGELGPRSEFISEWCSRMGMHYKVNDPAALGRHLKDRYLFLRRRREDVGRELPKVHKIVHDVEYDEKVLAKFRLEAVQLAKSILSSASSFNEKGLSSRKLEMKLRQMTGIAKAPYVASFVRDLVRSGEHVVLFGWHREVYDIWIECFSEDLSTEREKVPHYMFTGSESTKQKTESLQGFITGPPGVFIMSLRSGEGLNKLQTVSSMAIFGELDWSPQVHAQCIGRVDRPGQKDPVTSVFLVSSGGSDPVLSRLLGLKKEQSDGIVDPNATSDDVISDQVEVSRGTTLAWEVLDSIKSASKQEQLPL